MGLPSGEAKSPAGNMTGIIPPFVDELVVFCCRTCLLHGTSYVDFNFNGNNSVAQKPDDISMKAAISEHTDLHFPVYGFAGMDVYNAYYRYTPLVESPGVAFLIMIGSKGPFHQIILALSDVFPLCLMYIMLALLAGIIVWCLVSGNFMVQTVNGI